MAISINIYYRGRGNAAAEFAREMTERGITERIRRIEGNLQYEYFFPLEDDECVLLIDAWKDQAALDRHHASPMMSEIIKLREKYDLKMEVRRFLTDEGGIPESDRAFVRE